MWTSMKTYKKYVCGLIVVAMGTALFRFFVTWPRALTKNHLIKYCRENTGEY